MKYIEISCCGIFEVSDTLAVFTYEPGTMMLVVIEAATAGRTSVVHGSLVGPSWPMLFRHFCSLLSQRVRLEFQSRIRSPDPYYIWFLSPDSIQVPSHQCAQVE